MIAAWYLRPHSRKTAILSEVEGTIFISQCQFPSPYAFQSPNPLSRKDFRPSYPQKADPRRSGGLNLKPQNLLAVFGPGGPRERSAPREHFSDSKQRRFLIYISVKQQPRHTRMPPQALKKNSQPTVALARRKVAANNGRARPGRIKRVFPPRPTLEYDHSVLLTDDEDELELPLQEPVRPNPTVREQDLGEVLSRIHDNSLGCGRTIKAAIEFGRTAGQALAEARDIVGMDDFDGWVEKSLAISPAEARALLQFSRLAEVRGADVSPAKAVTLKTSLRLLSRLCDQFGEQAGKNSVSKQGCAR